MGLVYSLAKYIKCWQAGCEVSPASPAQHLATLSPSLVSIAATMTWTGGRGDQLVAPNELEDGVGSGSTPRRRRLQSALDPGQPTSQQLAEQDHPCTVYVVV